MSKWAWPLWLAEPLRRSYHRVHNLYAVEWRLGPKRKSDMGRGVEKHRLIAREREIERGERETRDEGMIGYLSSAVSTIVAG